MTIRRFFCLAPLVILLAVETASGQTSAPFKISIEQAANQPGPPLQSFAIGASGGKWLLVGGRTRGFHRTSQPEATFPSKYSNEYIYVVDYANDLAWKVGLPPKLKPLLRGSNKVLLGRIYGGILATAPQSSEFNPTYASATIYEVYLERLP